MHAPLPVVFLAAGSRSTEPPKIPTHTCPNGLTVLVAENHAVPLISVGDALVQGIELGKRVEVALGRRCRVDRRESASASTIEVTTALRMSPPDSGNRAARKSMSTEARSSGAGNMRRHSSPRSCTSGRPNSTTTCRRRANASSRLVFRFVARIAMPEWRSISARTTPRRAAAR